ncbi:MAG: hypothetical protein AB7U81_01185 [Thiohalomonadaceae bacterium]
MHTLLVVYETADPAHEEALRRFVEGFDAMRFSPDSYAVETDLEADEVFRRIQPLLGRDDIAYVFTLGDRWMGYGYQAMNDWLHRNLH